MAFDPDAYLSKSPESTPSKGGFDPDAYLSKTQTDPGVKGDLKVAGEAALRAAPGGVGFFAGAGAGAAAVAPLAAATVAMPLVSGAIELTGGLLGGLVASGAADWAVDKLTAIVDPEGYKRWQQAKQEHPLSAEAGGMLGGFAGASPKTAAKVAGKWWTDPLAQRGFSAAGMGGVTAAQQLVTEGEVNPKAVAISAAGGAAMPGANIVGKLAHGAGAGAVGLVKGGKPATKPELDTRPPDMPEPPKPDASPEEKQKALDEIKRYAQERAEKVPLVEAAIRNKETGEIERMGPKHDEARKAETADTHEQGFVDEKGNFLNRKESWNRAVKSSQIPPDAKPEFPLEGLHSGDLRTHGDERFKVTPEQPAGEPKPEAPPTAAAREAPKTREDYKKSIEDLWTQHNETFLQEEFAKIQNDPKALEQAQKTRTEIEQKIKEHQAQMPEVQFKDKAVPTDAELRDHLYGINNTGDALNHLLTTGVGTRGQTALMDILRRSAFVRDAKLELKDDYHYVINMQGEKIKASGSYVGGNEHKITLAKEGDVQTLLHEVVHAATQRLLLEGTSDAAKAMQKLWAKYKLEYQAETNRMYKEAMQTGEPSRMQEVGKRGSQKLTYGFKDEHEFASEAFTNKHFQNILKGMSRDEKLAGGGVIKNLWEEFKNIIFQGLGITGEAKTALHDVLDHGLKLIEESKEFKPIHGEEKVSAAVAPMSEETKKAILEEPKEKIPDPRSMENEKQFKETAADILEKHGDVEAVKFYQGYQEYKKTWLEPVKETEKFVGINLNNKMATERIIHNNTGDLKQLAGKNVDLEKLTYDIDKGVHIAGEAKDVADKFRDLMDELGKRAFDAGVIKGWFENYVARNVISEGKAPKGALETLVNDLFGTHDPGTGGVATSSKYGKPRVLKTREDLVNHLNVVNEHLAKAGQDYRFKLKTDNLAEIYKDYALSVEKAIENKKLVENIQQIRNAAGETMIRDINKDNPMPYGWKVMEGHSELAGKAVHPDMLPALKFVFDAGPGDLMKALGAISQLTKHMNVIGSFFHAKSLMEVLSSTGIPIWTPIKEVSLGAADKLLGTKFSGLTKAVEQFKKGGVGDSVDKWMKEGGLQLEPPEDVSKGILTAAGKFTDQMIGKYGPKTRVLEKSLSTVEKYTLGKFDQFTWDYLHTGGKIMVAEAKLDQARQQAAKAGKPFDEAASRKEIARFVNESFGGLNWFDAARDSRTEFGKRIAMAAMSPQGRRALQVAMFAPDWTVSTVRAFSSALPKELNPTKWHPVEGVKGMMTPTTKADYARLYQFKTALTYFTLLNAINLMTANRPIWDNKDPTRIEFPDGTSLQAMKHAMEPYHWIADPDKTLSNKLGFIPKAAIVGIAGTEYASPVAPKMVDPSGPERLKAIAGMAAPFQLQAGTGAPEGEGAKRAILGTLGFPMYGSTPEQKKQARAERTKKQKELMKKYREREQAAGRQ